MARADSTIRVLILGDSKGLKGELAEADRGIKGFAVNAKTVVGGIAATVVADRLVDFGKTALQEADRLGDAGKRLELSLGPDLARNLEDRADEFSDLGQSAQDMLELEAAFTDIAKAAGAGEGDIAKFAEDAAATAAAAALLGDTDAATVVEAIAKAASGDKRALRTLGIDLDDAAVAAQAMQDTGKDIPELLTDSELAAAAYKLILEKLAPKIDAVSGANAGLEERLGTFDAKMETLTGKIGEHLEGPLNGLLDWVLSGIEGWEILADRMDDVPGLMDSIGKAAGLLFFPLATLRDLLDDIAAGAGSVFDEGDLPGGGNPGQTGAPGGGGWRASGVTVNVNGGDPAEVERAVAKAVGGYIDRNGKLMWDP